MKKIRTLLDQYENRIGIGEVYAPPPGDAKNVARYLRSGDDGVHLAFDFSLILARWSASSYYRISQGKDAGRAQFYGEKEKFLPAGTHLWQCPVLDKPEPR